MCANFKKTIHRGVITTRMACSARPQLVHAEAILPAAEAEPDFMRSYAL